MQRYRCSTCGRRFRDNLGFEHRQMPRLPITPAPMPSGMGLSVANICMTLAHRGVRMHVDTMTRILSKIVGDYARTIKAPHIPYARGCGKTEQRIRGEKRRIVAVMDIATWRMLTRYTSDTKENHDADSLPRAAKGVAGKILWPFIADDPDQYHIDFKKLWMV